MLKHYIRILKWSHILRYRSCIFRDAVSAVCMLVTLCCCFQLSMWRLKTIKQVNRASVLSSLVTKLFQLFCHPIDCGPPGSSVHGILQSRIMEWLAIPFSSGSFWLRDKTCVCWLAGGFFTTEPPQSSVRMWRINFKSRKSFSLVSMHILISFLISLTSGAGKTGQPLVKEWN